MIRSRDKKHPFESKVSVTGPMAAYYQQRVAVSQNRWERMALIMMIQLCQWQENSNE